jgi:hypothetical protein
MNKLLKDGFLEKLIDNFMSKSLTHIHYDGEYLTGNIVQNLKAFYIGCFDYYYIMISIALILYFLVLAIKIHIVGKNQYNMAGLMIQSFGLAILFFVFPFLFNFILTICAYIADRIFSIEEMEAFYNDVFGKDSAFNANINPASLNETKKTGIVSFLKNSKAKVEHVARVVQTEPMILIKSGITVVCGYIGFIAYTALLTVRFIALSLCFALAPIFLPLTLFGWWGARFFESYMKTIVNLALWVVLKAIIDRVLHSFFLSMEGGFNDDLLFIALMVSYAVMIGFIPLIVSNFIGGVNFTPAVAASSVLQHTVRQNVSKTARAIAQKVNPNYSGGKEL